MPESSIYITTERAGFVVAGHRIPGAYREAPGADGRPATVFRPKVGFELELTAAEAEYELQQGTIAAKPAGKTQKPKPDAAAEA